MAVSLCIHLSAARKIRRACARASYRVNVLHTRCIYRINCAFPAQLPRRARAVKLIGRIPGTPLRALHFNLNLVRVAPFLVHHRARVYFVQLERLCHFKKSSDKMGMVRYAATASVLELLRLPAQ